MSSIPFHFCCKNFENFAANDIPHHQEAKLTSTPESVLPGSSQHVTVASRTTFLDIIIVKESVEDAQKVIRRLTDENIAKALRHHKIPYVTHVLTPATQQVHFPQRSDAKFSVMLHPSSLNCAAAEIQAKCRLMLTHNITLGSKWIVIGSSRPEMGIELKNEKLAVALQQKDEFTQVELSRFKVSDLSSETYIKAGAKYFKPDYMNPWYKHCHECKTRHQQDNIEKQEHHDFMGGLIFDQTKSLVTTVMKFHKSKGMELKKEDIRCMKSGGLPKLAKLRAAVRIAKDHKIASPSPSTPAPSCETQPTVIIKVETDRSVPQPHAPQQERQNHDRDYSSIDMQQVQGHNTENLQEHSFDDESVESQSLCSESDSDQDDMSSTFVVKPSPSTPATFWDIMKGHINKEGKRKLLVHAGAAPRQEGSIMQMKFDLDVSWTGTKGSVLRTDFKRQVLLDLAKASALTPDNFSLTKLKQSHHHTLFLTLIVQHSKAVPDPSQVVALLLEQVNCKNVLRKSIRVFRVDIALNSQSDATR